MQGTDISTSSQQTIDSQNPPSPVAAGGHISPVVTPIVSGTEQIPGPAADRGSLPVVKTRRCHTQRGSNRKSTVVTAGCTSSSGQLQVMSHSATTTVHQEPLTSSHSGAQYSVSSQVGSGPSMPTIATDSTIALCTIATSTPICSIQVATTSSGTRPQAPHKKRKTKADFALTDQDQQLVMAKSEISRLESTVADLQNTLGVLKLRIATTLPVHGKNTKGNQLTRYSPLQ